MGTPEKAQGWGECRISKCPRRAGILLAGPVEKISDNAKGLRWQREDPGRVGLIGRRAEGGKGLRSTKPQGTISSSARGTSLSASSLCSQLPPLTLQLLSCEILINPDIQQLYLGSGVSKEGRVLMVMGTKRGLDLPPSPSPQEKGLVLGEPRGWGKCLPAAEPGPGAASFSVLCLPQPGPHD